MKIDLSFILFISSLFIGGCTQNEHPAEWSFQTGGPIMSHPVLNGSTLFFGSNDQNFYALDTQTRQARWVFSTSSPVQSQALIHEETVYFSTGNTVFALDEESGSERWSYVYLPDSTGGQIDPWDYHHGSPLVVGELIYFGLSDGKLCGFDLESGKIIDQYTTTDSAVIRCSPGALGQTIYFGDWNGRVYAYDTAQRDTLWTYKTFPERLYATFGQLNTEFVVYDSLLLFGGRNPQLQVLNLHTGKPVWSYTSEEGGWMSGDPLVLNDTLYIGGSDNHKLFAFDVRSGRLIWEFEFLFNNFSNPVIIGDQILFTTGDANSVYRADDGLGYLYSVDRFEGQLVNFTLFDANAFSTPVIDESSIYLTSEDSRLYAVDKKAFLSQPGNLADRGYYSIEILQTSIPSFQDSVNIHFRVNFQTQLEVRMLDLEGSLLRHWPVAVYTPGDHSLTWAGTDKNGASVGAGYYYFEIKSGQYYQTGYVQKLE